MQTTTGIHNGALLSSIVSNLLRGIFEVTTLKSLSFAYLIVPASLTDIKLSLILGRFHLASIILIGLAMSAREGG